MQQKSFVFVYVDDKTHFTQSSSTTMLPVHEWMNASVRDYNNEIADDSFHSQ